MGRPHKSPLASFVHRHSIAASMTRIAGVIVMVLAALLLSQHRASAEVFRDCGGFLREPRGVVHSPGFPVRFPLPIDCRWVIEVPRDKKIVLYFTQYFLRRGFYVTEYEHYTNEQTYVGRKSLGQINFEERIRTVVAYKPFLALDFILHDITNVHLRVEDDLANVYGFNITYEIVGRWEHVRQDTCSVDDCSFLGHCLASADFSEYKCHCFDGFFGKECQYGPYCDPDKGVNMCLNEGRCRYFFGVTVNMCDCAPGYEGKRCEHKEDSLDKECKKLGCSDRCTRGYEGHLICACPDGFKLDTDNVTCVEQENFRVSVAVLLAVKRHVPWDEERATKLALLKLQLSGVRSATRFRFDGVNSSSGRDVQLFHFYLDRSDTDASLAGVDNLLRGGNLFNLSVVPANRTVQLDPEMKLLSVEHYSPRTALEGKSLTLVCTARGSANLQFRWYKDQFLFDASLTSRDAWEVRIEEDYGDKQMSILNVEGVTLFDKGEFSCEIEDFGEVENKSVMVDVIPLPQVEIKPLVSSMPEGQPVSFRCLFPDENMRTFSYQWLRDGRELNNDGKNGEIVEDLLPSGSRLYIPRLAVSANYTCKVVNKAGAAEKSAFVYLIPSNMSEMYCESNAYEGVKWNRTYGGYHDLQMCPIDTADFKVVGLGEGYARRDCLCDVTCSWGPPNYARCHSVRLTYLYEQLERCQLGYQLDGLNSIYDSLYEILGKAQNRTLAGDVDMFAINLHSLFDVSLHFPAVAPDSAKSDFNLKTVGNFMSILLHEVKSANEFEKRDLSVGARLVRVCEILAELSTENPTLIPLHNLTLPRIAFSVKNVTVKTNTNNFDPDDPDVDSGSSSVGYTGRQLMSYFTDIRLKEDPEVETEVVERQLEVLQVTFSSDIFPILSVGPQRPDYDQFLTPLVSLLPVGNDDQEDDGASLILKDGRVELEFVHRAHVRHTYPVFMENTTKCIAWVRPDIWELVGEWKSGVCEVTHRTPNVTKCLCPVSGHYAVVLTPSNVTVAPIEYVSHDTVLLVGCIISLCGLAAALVIYFINWRHISGASSVIHVNFILSLAGINLVCIICLNQSEREVLCIASKLVLYFMELAAFAFLFMEAIHTCVSIQSARSNGLSHIKNICVKYFFVGWVIPSIATVAVFLLYKVFGYDETCSKWCWWSIGQWQYYGFLVPLLLMVLVQVVIMSVCLMCTRMWKDEQRFQDRKKYTYIPIRAFILEALVVLLLVSGHTVEADPATTNQWFFVSIDIILTITVIITLVILKPYIRRIVFSFLLPAHQREAFSSFRVFILPDRVDDSEELEVKQIQQYCAELNRSKYTSQHKQALRSLLGSSSSGSDASASATGSPPGTETTAISGGAAGGGGAGGNGASANSSGVSRLAVPAPAPAPALLGSLQPPAPAVNHRRRGVNSAELRSCRNGSGLRASAAASGGGARRPPPEEACEDDEGAGRREMSARPGTNTSGRRIPRAEPGGGGGGGGRGGGAGKGARKPRGTRTAKVPAAGQQQQQQQQQQQRLLPPSPSLPLPPSRGGDDETDFCGQREHPVECVVMNCETSSPLGRTSGSQRNRNGGGGGGDIHGGINGGSCRGNGRSRSPHGDRPVSYTTNGVPDGSTYLSCNGTATSTIENDNRQHVGRKGRVSGPGGRIGHQQLTSADTPHQSPSSSLPPPPSPSPPPPPATAFPPLPQPNGHGCSPAGERRSYNNNNTPLSSPYGCHLANPPLPPPPPPPPTPPLPPPPPPPPPASSSPSSSSSSFLLDSSSPSYSSSASLSAGFSHAGREDSRDKSAGGAAAAAAAEHPAVIVAESGEEVAGSDVTADVTSGARVILAANGRKHAGGGKEEEEEQDGDEQQQQQQQHEEEEEEEDDRGGREEREALLTCADLMAAAASADEEEEAAGVRVNGESDRFL